MQLFADDTLLYWLIRCIKFLHYSDVMWKLVIFFSIKFDLIVTPHPPSRPQPGPHVSGVECRSLKLDPRSSAGVE